MTCLQKTFRMFRTRRIAAGLLALAVVVSAGELATVFAQSQESSDKQELLDAYRQGGAFYKQGKYREAARCYERAVELAPAVHGGRSPEAATLMNNLAELYWLMGQHAKAEPLYQRSLQIREAKLGKDHPAVATSLNDLALLYQSTSQYAKAEPLYQRSLQIREAKLGKDHPAVATSLNDLAGLYKDMGQYAKAESLYQRSLKIREAKLGKDHPDVAISLNNLALVYLYMGRYAKSEPLYLRSLKIQEAKLGKDHPVVATSLNNLAGLYQNMGQYAKAEPLYQRSLKIREAKLGADHPQVAISLNNLANLYVSMGQYAKAEPLSKHSLQIREAKLGKDHPDVASSLNNLAMLYKSMGQYAKAEPLLQQSLKVFEARLGEDHPYVATSLNNLALLYQSLGQYDKAEPLYQRALDIARVRLGRFHPSHTLYQQNLALLLAAQGRTREAIRLIHPTLQAQRQHTIQVLPILTESEQLRFVQQQKKSQANALSLAWQSKLDEENANRSASWLINTKAVGQQAVSERLLLARDADTPEARQLLDELNTTRRELARLSTGIPPKGDENNWKQRRQELAEKEQRLTAQLSQGNQRGFRDDPWIDLDEVIRRLPRSGIFVDFARFPVRNFTARGNEKTWKAARYVAWINSRDRGVQIIDLGDAAEINRLIEKVQKALAAAPQQIRNEGEPQAEQDLHDQLKELSRRLLDPLRKHLDDAEHWILSPDGNLWLVPWAALPLSEKSYVIEKHTIQLLISGRDLVLNPLQLDRKTTAPVILADPDFDLGREELARQSRQATKMPDTLVQRGTPEGLRLGKVPRLSGTAAEAEAVAPALQKWLNVRPQVYTGEQAVASRLRGMHSPRVVMLSTHGFFLPERKPLNGAAGGEAKPHELQNPLLRCGLLLAGCNSAGVKAANDETGVLTGMDVVSTDLRGTELVVLSACETGLGDVRNGEGVAGLRQAFQLAGARSVISTLWQIPDRQSAQLMSSFFDQLAKGKNKAEALREAQLSLIKARRNRSDAAHPFFWAAFTLTGQ